ncbi:uncharacterized protein LOC103021692 [Astyanax mexicanus]|uniref:uncharacterized protein LOC103021692 n=1 Tax=Astyanax mexicanus TaxID=7994 RepID=UPI0020CAB997|nr:uncharacterized protein LOC103021692 [Astyanax mexicanus]XP_049339017.1 uncharacterized protein LOC103021692 [Astyanax mexicanus]
MKPLSLLVCGLFISSLCSSSDSSLDVSVTQTPVELTVEEGQSVKISCCWNKIIPNIKVRWIKPNQTNKDVPTEILNTNCSVFSIRNACSNDTGLYICEVLQDIPVLVTVKGKGTTVRLLEKKPDNNTTGFTNSSLEALSDSSLSPLVPIVGASVPAAVILICLCVSVAVWRTCRKPERMVIREGPASEGEEPEHSEGDDSSRNSRGSTQWYMVPVYESYFDLQRNDEEESSNEDQSTKSDKTDSLGKNGKTANHK